MCTTVAVESAAASAAASVVLPDPAGPSRHTNRTAPSWGRRPATVRTRAAARSAGPADTTRTVQPQTGLPRPPPRSPADLPGVTFPPLPVFGWRVRRGPDPAHRRTVRSSRDPTPRTRRVRRRHRKPARTRRAQRSPAGPRCGGAGRRGRSRGAVCAPVGRQLAGPGDAGGRAARGDEPPGEGPVPARGRHQRLPRPDGRLHPADPAPGRPGDHDDRRPGGGAQRPAGHRAAGPDRPGRQLRPGGGAGLRQRRGGGRPRAGPGPAVRAGDEHRPGPHQRAQLRVLQRGPAAVRDHRRRERPRHPVPRRHRHGQALGGQQPGGQPDAGQRGHPGPRPARDLRAQLRHRRRPGQPRLGDVFLQPHRHGLLLLQCRDAGAGPARAVRLRRLRRLGLPGHARGHRHRRRAQRRAAHRGQRQPGQRAGGAGRRDTHAGRHRHPGPRDPDRAVPVRAVRPGRPGDLPDRRGRRRGRRAAHRGAERGAAEERRRRAAGAVAQHRRHRRDGEDLRPGRRQQPGGPDLGRQRLRRDRRPCRQQREGQLRRRVGPRGGRRRGEVGRCRAGLRPRLLQRGLGPGEPVPAERPGRAGLRGRRGQPAHRRRPRDGCSGPDAVAGPGRRRRRGLVPRCPRRGGDRAAARRGRQLLRQAAADLARLRLPGARLDPAAVPRGQPVGDVLRGRRGRLPLVRRQRPDAAVPVRRRAVLHQLPVLGTDAVPQQRHLGRRRRRVLRREEHRGVAPARRSRRSTSASRTGSSRPRRTSWPPSGR